MRTYFDCVPCAIRQALDSARMVSDDERIHEQVLREALQMALDLDYSMSPPARAQRLHSRIRELTGAADAYYALKRRYNRLALEMLPEAREAVAEADDPMEAAVRLAIAGNIIDFGIGVHAGEAKIRRTLDRALHVPFDTMALDAFGSRAKAAAEILYIADNAGEIVFDRLLIERLGAGKVTLAVKGSPILNDALLEDAEEAGLADIVAIIDNGDNSPGTILERCSEDFRERFERADMVISKGQGNYETLNDADRDIFFLLQAKCAVIARHLDCEIGTFVLRLHEPERMNRQPVTERG